MTKQKPRLSIRGAFHADDQPTQPEQPAQPAPARAPVAGRAVGRPGSTFPHRRNISEHRVLSFRTQTPSQRMRGDFEKEVEATRRRLSNHHATIDPTGRYMRRWDVVMLTALLFTAIVTPYEVALLTTQLDALFIINRVVDTIFVKDIVMQFFLMFQEPIQRGGTWVTDRRRIARRYLTSWFPVDVISILPFDIVAWQVQSNSVGRLKALRILRLFRLLKLMRVLRAGRIFRRWEANLSVSYGIIMLVKFTILLIFVGHWLACSWVLVHVIQCDDDCMAACSEASAPLSIADGLFNQPPGSRDGCVKTWLTVWSQGRHKSPFQTYAIAIYWSVTTLTSIGYGDVTAVNEDEFVATTCFMMFAGICWAYIIGNTCGIIATLDFNAMQFHHTMDRLNNFMSDKALPAPLRVRLRAYFHQVRVLHASNSYRNLVDVMSPALRGEVCVSVSDDFLRQISYFANIGRGFLVEVSQRINGAVFAPNELLDQLETVVQMKRGVVSKAGRLHGSGAVWGEDMILDCIELQDATPALALTYVEVQTLSKPDMLEVIEWFPDVVVHMRKAVVRMAARRGVLLEAQRRRRHRVAVGGDGEAETLA
eukprot:g6043.t1